MSNRPTNVMLLALLCLTQPVLAADSPTDAKTGFTDITVESGIADIVARQRQYMAKVLAGNHDEVPYWWLSGFTLVDMTGSGKLDLHLGAHGQPAVSAWNDGKGHFTEVPYQPEIKRSGRATNDNPLPGGELRLMYDLNEDGKPDMVISYRDNEGATYLNQCLPPGAEGNPTAAPVWNFKPVVTGFDSFSRAVAFIDLNRDGLVDYLVTGDAGRKNPTSPLQVYLGKGEVHWERTQPDIQVPKESAGIPCDINGDGFIDLVCSARGYNDHKRWILINDGKMNFTNATKDCGLSEDGNIMGVGDLNQDGYPDLICFDLGPDGKSLEMALYINDGKGHFTKDADFAVLSAKLPKIKSSNWGGAVVTDFDNDGIADIAVNGRWFLFILRGLGGGKFEYVNERWHIPSSISNSVDDGLCFGDIDGDGMLDFVTQGPNAGASGENRSALVLRNDLPKHNWVNVQLVGKKGNRNAAGSIIRVTESGTGKLLWCEQVCIWGRQSFHSYYFAANTERHFGLGDRAEVDVSVEFYPSGKKVEAKGIKADRTIIVNEETGVVGEQELPPAR